MATMYPDLESGTMEYQDHGYGYRKVTEFLDWRRRNNLWSPVTPGIQYASPLPPEILYNPEQHFNPSPELQNRVQELPNRVQEPQFRHQEPSACSDRGAMATDPFDFQMGSEFQGVRIQPNAQFRQQDQPIRLQENYFQYQESYFNHAPESHNRVEEPQIRVPDSQIRHPEPQFHHFVPQFSNLEVQSKPQEGQSLRTEHQNTSLSESCDKLMGMVQSLSMNKAARFISQKGWFVWGINQAFGPYCLGELRELFTNGYLNEDSLLWFGEVGEWKSLSTIFEWISKLIGIGCEAWTPMASSLEKKAGEIQWPVEYISLNNDLEYGAAVDIFEDEFSFVLHQQSKVSDLDHQLLDMPLEIAAEFEEIGEVNLDFVLEHADLELEEIELKEECRIDLEILDVGMCFEELDDMQVEMVVGVPGIEINGADIENGCIMAMKAKVKSVKAFNIGVGYEKRVNKHEFGFGGVLLNIVCNDHGILDLPWNFRKRKKRVKSLYSFALVLGDKDSFNFYVSIFDPGICLGKLNGDDEVNESWLLEEVVVAATGKSNLFKVEKSCFGDHGNITLELGVKMVEADGNLEELELPADAFVCLSYKMLVVCWAVIVESEILWDYKRYKKRVKSLVLRSLVVLGGKDNSERQGNNNLCLKTLRFYNISLFTCWAELQACENGLLSTIAKDKLLFCKAYSPREGYVEYHELRLPGLMLEFSKEKLLNLKGSALYHSVSESAVCFVFAFVESSRTRILKGGAMLQAKYNSPIGFSHVAKQGLYREIYTKL